jgi:hypothetical protein
MLQKRICYRYVPTFLNRLIVSLIYIADGISEVIAGGEDVLGGYYLADQSSSHHLARLHVLVCGFCHSVFHVLEEFKR